MTNPELENLIRVSLKSGPRPSRASLLYTLKTLSLPQIVTENKKIRYTKETVWPNIINNRIAGIVSFWKMKRILLIPSFILIFFIGIFSLSPQATPHESNLRQLVEQDELIEEPGIDYDDQVLPTSFDEPSLNDLSVMQNEI